MSPARTRDQEFHDEIEAHLALETEQLIAEGLSPAEARATARRRFGNVTAARERHHDAGTFAWIDHLAQDTRAALRAMRRHRGVVVVALLSLALGIGATTAIVSVASAALLRPLPYQDPDRLVMVWEEMTSAGFPTNTPAPANFVDWRERNRVFTDMAATAPARANLTGGGTPERVLGRGVTASFFTVLGVAPVLGRAFTPEEERQNAPVVVISYGLWQRRFASDPTVVGRAITMSDAAATVIGVMPASFAFRDREMDFWRPIGFGPAQWGQRGNHFLNVLARLRPGVSLDQARQDMRAIAADLERQHLENIQVGVALVPMRQDILGDLQQQLSMLAVAAGCLLLLMAANLANLLVARAAARRREWATRAALGAGRGRLVALVVSEGILWSVVGGALGIIVATAGLEALNALIPQGLAETAVPELDMRLLLLALALSLATGVAFSLLPAVRASRIPPNDVLKATAGGLGGGWHTRSALITLQIAMSVALLVGAGLMVQSLLNVRSLELGFRPDGALTANTPLPTPRYDASRRARFYEQVTEDLRAVPGVEAAGFGSTLPFTSRGNTAAYRVDGRSEREPGDALLRIVTPGYLEAMGARLLAGRLPDARDGADAPRVVVVNQAMVNRHWPDGMAIGRQVALGSGSQFPWMEVIGVVADIRENGYEVAQRPGMYLLAAQSGFPADSLVLRTTGDPLAMAPAVRAVVARADPEQPVAALRTMNAIVDLEILDRRQQSIVLVTFAVTALLLATIGIYGLVSFSVAMRRREVGLRTALGATMNEVTRTLVRHGLWLVGAGVVIGVVTSLLGARLLEGLLFGIEPQDPQTLLGITMLVTIVSMVACWLPAWRAAHVPPMTALRQE